MSKINKGLLKINFLIWPHTFKLHKGFYTINWKYAIKSADTKIITTRL